MAPERIVHGNNPPAFDRFCFQCQAFIFQLTIRPTRDMLAVLLAAFSEKLTTRLGVSDLHRIWNWLIEISQM